MNNHTKALWAYSVDNVWEEIWFIRSTLHFEQPIQREVLAMLSLESTITKDSIKYIKWSRILNVTDMQPESMRYLFSCTNVHRQNSVSDYISCQRQSMKTKDTASQCIDVDHSYDKWVTAKRKNITLSSISEFQCEWGLFRRKARGTFYVILFYFTFLNF